jgi:hypothetical protein
MKCRIEFLNKLLIAQEIDDTVDVAIVLGDSQLAKGFGIQQLFVEAFHVRVIIVPVEVMKSKVANQPPRKVWWNVKRW